VAECAVIGIPDLLKGTSRLGWWCSRPGVLDSLTPVLRAARP
jgi:hypothetical protein